MIFLNETFFVIKANKSFKIQIGDNIYFSMINKNINEFIKKKTIFYLVFRSFQGKKLLALYNFYIML